MHKNSIKIIYEDNHLLVVEKPVNLPTQADATGDMDLLTLLKQDIKLRYNKPGNVFIGMVHRLDRPVGGIMVFAKTSKAASRLSEQIRKRELKKTYLAVSHGVLTQPSGQMKHYLLKDTKTNIVRAVSQNIAGAKEAILDYVVIGKTEKFSLVKINLHTGRPHQIRVQFSQIGHPIYGDQKYGSDVNSKGQQIALWSSQINFKHPITSEEIFFKSKPSAVYPWNLFDMKIY